MKMSKLKKIMFVIVVFTVLSIPFTQSLIQSVPGVYAVKLDNDENILVAEQTLKSNIKGISILDYDSLKFHLISHRIIQPMIWIGHGEKEGIAISDVLTTWSDFSKNLHQSRSLDIILSCYSTEIIHQSSLTTNDVVTFNGEIDAVLGSLVASYVITKSQETLNQIGYQYFSLALNEVNYLPLALIGGDIGGGDIGGGDDGEDDDYNFNIPPSFTAAQNSYSYVFWKLSGIELAYHLIMLLLLALELMLTIPLRHMSDAPLFFKIAVHFFYVVPSLLTSFALYDDGIISESVLIGDLIGMASDAWACLRDAWHSFTLGEKWQFVGYFVIGGVMLTFQILADCFALGTITIVRTAATVSLILYFVYCFFIDAFDVDTVVG
jgi:hypothetical protein